jgi:transcriptional regulator with XRE-family HTH domain
MRTSCQEVFKQGSLSLLKAAVREPEQPEIARRIKAALSYGHVSRTAAAAAMSVSPSHLDRFTARDARYVPSWSQLWALAEICGLPPEWFSADLLRLSEIVTDGPVLTQRGAPHIPGETGRRVEGRQTTAAGRRQPRSDQDSAGPGGGTG